MKSIITFRGRSIINSGMALKMSKGKYRPTKMTSCVGKWFGILYLFLCTILSSSASIFPCSCDAAIINSRPFPHTWTISNTNSIVHRFVSACLSNSYIRNVIMMINETLGTVGTEDSAAHYTRFHWLPMHYTHTQMFGESCNNPIVVEYSLLFNSLYAICHFLMYSFLILLKIPERALSLSVSRLSYVRLTHQIEPFGYCTLWHFCNSSVSQKTQCQK